MHNYELLQEIGHGAYSIVFKANTISTNTIVAIKRINHTNPDVAIVLARQIRTLKILQHPNIIKLIQVFNDNLYVYLVCQYLPYDLIAYYKYIKKNKGRNLNDDQITYIVWQMCQALHYLHQLGIMHRDIKPENVLIQPNTLTIKLIDFGFAKQFNPYAQNTQYMITRWYRPLEIVLNLGYDSKADVFALGALVMELYQGQQIFRSASNLDQLYWILQICGYPSTWPQAIIKMSQLGINFNPKKQAQIFKMTQHMRSQAINLLISMLQTSPYARISLQQIIRHPYFSYYLQKNKRNINTTSRQSILNIPIYTQYNNIQNNHTINNKSSYTNLNNSNKSNTYNINNSHIYNNTNITNNKNNTNNTNNNINTSSKSKLKVHANTSTNFSTTPNSNHNNNRTNTINLLKNRNQNTSNSKTTLRQTGDSLYKNKLTLIPHLNPHLHQDTYTTLLNSNKSYLTPNNSSRLQLNLNLDALQRSKKQQRSMLLSTQRYKQYKNKQKIHKNSESNHSILLNTSKQKDLKHNQQKYTKNSKLRNYSQRQIEYSKNKIKTQGNTRINKNQNNNSYTQLANCLPSSTQRYLITKKYDNQYKLPKKQERGLKSRTKSYTGINLVSQKKKNCKILPVNPQRNYHHHNSNYTYNKTKQQANILQIPNLQRKQPTFTKIRDKLLHENVSHGKFKISLTERNHIFDQKRKWYLGTGNG